MKGKVLMENQNEKFISYHLSACQPAGVFPEPPLPRRWGPEGSKLLVQPQGPRLPRGP